MTSLWLVVAVAIVVGAYLLLRRKGGGSREGAMGTLRRHRRATHGGMSEGEAALVAMARADAAAAAKPATPAPVAAAPTATPAPGDLQAIVDWHAHVYFDAQSRDAALALRQDIGARFGNRVALGRFHERPVGPHPQWSYQLAFTPSELADVLSWLALHHGALDVLVHPNTGDPLRDHRDSAVWIGRSYDLDLRAVGG